MIPLKNGNHISSKKFGIYVIKNLPLIMTLELYSRKNTIKYEIIVITLVNIGALLIIFVT